MPTYFQAKFINVKSSINPNIPIPKNINNHCVIDNLPLSAIICSSLFLSTKTIISPIIKKKNPKQNPAIGE